MIPLVSHHAVVRYVERIDPAATFEAARAALEQALRFAIRFPRDERRGAIWRAIRPNCVLVVDMKTEPPRVVTVMTPGRADGRVV